MDSPYMSFTSQGKDIISTVLSFFTGSSDNINQSGIMTEKKGYQELSPFEVNPDSTTEYKSDQTMAGGWKIGNVLDKMHKRTPQEDLWFSGGGRKENMFLSSNHPQVTSDFHPSTWYSNINQKHPHNTSNQMAFNITKNCYETLPVSQIPLPQYSYYQHCPDVDQGPVYQEQIMTNIMNLVEDSLVEMVCLKSSLPSPHRLAGQTLANSDLNPNAKEFTPKIVNESVIFDLKDTLDQEDVNKSTLDDSIESGDEHSFNFESATDSRTTEECAKKCVVLGRSYNCDFLIIPNATDDDSSHEDDDDSDWWDSDDEQINGQCIEIDPLEFQDLMPCPLFVSNITAKKNSSSSSSKKTPSKEVDPLFDSSQDCGSESYGSISSDENLIQINQLYFCDKDDVPCSRTKECKVQFCDNLNVVIEEPDNISEDLAEARVSDFKQRQADKERMEILLRPILSSLHREKMYRDIYGQNLKAISNEK